MRNLIFLAVLLPVPIFRTPMLPAPRWIAETEVVEVQIHEAKPTVKPAVLSHSYRGWGKCGCLMCLGQHLRNMHGISYKELEGRQWKVMHNGLHDVGVVKSSSTGSRSGCGPGGCFPSRRRFLFLNLRRMFR